MAAGPFSNLTANISFPLPEDTVSVPWDRVERFVGQLAHDIRNGLNALELQLTFLGEISIDPEAVDEVKRLRATLQDMTRHLQTVKLATAPVLPHVLDYPAADLLEDLRERFERLHPAVAATVSWDVQVSPTVFLLVDPDLTINGLLELFANAIRSGSTSLGCATVETPDGLSVVLTETATGPVAPTEAWGEPLFTTRRGAYGLGLFRVRRILAAQGGSIAFHFAPTTQQLTTTVGLPLAGTPPRNA